MKTSFLLSLLQACVIKEEAEPDLSTGETARLSLSLLPGDKRSPLTLGRVLHPIPCLSFSTCNETATLSPSASDQQGLDMVTRILTHG